MYSTLAYAYFRRRGGDWKHMVGHTPSLRNHALKLTFFALFCPFFFFRAILHDPTSYPEPDTFKPERFLNPDGSVRDDPVLLSAFGFGKRICPGRHLVDTTLFNSVASLLSVFNFERAKDGGWDKPSDYTYTAKLVK